MTRGRAAPWTTALWGTLFVFAVTPISTEAQDPIARAEVSPGGVVTVGQPVTVTVTVLVPSFFQGAPAYPDLEIDDAFAIFNDRGSNLSERIDGVTWAGQSRSYTIYPQRPGVFEIATIPVEVRYRGDGGAVTATASPPPIRFEARIPPEAAGLDYFVAATDLTVQESFDVRPDTIRVGDAFARTITVTVSDALSMVIPPLEPASIPGLAIYPDPPRVDDTSGERGARLVGTRVETVSYVAQEEGEYRLPGIEISWWDVGAERMRSASVPEVSFVVVANPNLVNELGLPPDSAVVGAGTGPAFTAFSIRDLIREYGPPVTLVLALAALAYRLLRRYGPGWAARLRDERARRAESEAVYYGRFRKSAASGDPRVVANALMAWLDRRHRGPGVATVGAFATRADDPALNRALSDLGDRLYGVRSAATGVQWSASELVRAVARARKRQRTSRMTTSEGGQLTQLNPTPRGR